MSQPRPAAVRNGGTSSPSGRAGGAGTLVNWMRFQLRWITLPSWGVSIVLHLLLGMAFLAISQSPGCRGDFGGEQGEEFRAVGIRERAPSPVEADTNQPSEVEAPPQAVPQRAPAVASMVPNQPPVPLTLPSNLLPAPPVIGAGAPAAFDATQFSNVIQPNTQASPPAGGGTVNGPAERRTSFLGISDVGRRFVYVIDRSSSMEEDGRLRAAKTDLLASLDKLNESQQFQIIFYNAYPTVLKPRNDRFDMFFGTDAQRLQVSDQLRSIVPDGGTRHFPALIQALKFKPDVIFLLTDGAAESALSSRELDDLRVRNGGGARIHCIEFGRGSKSVNGASAASGNYLDRLARENQGQYVYRDVTQFRLRE